MYFGRTPNPTNGGKYYQHSPEFTFRHFITYNDNILNEFMINHLSFVRFPPLEESFFSFQRKVIQELLLRCYYGKDLDGFLQVSRELLVVFNLNRIRSDSKCIAGKAASSIQ